MELENPENSPAEVVSAIDQPPPQVPASQQSLRTGTEHLQMELISSGKIMKVVVSYPV